MQQPKAGEIIESYFFWRVGLTLQGLMRNMNPPKNLQQKQAESIYDLYS